jgi:hypothetical protein
MSDNKTTKEFISNIVEKNYKQANVSLHKMVETKIKERIKQSLEQKNNSK